MAEKSSEHMIDSVWWHTRFPDNKPGILVLNVTDDAWKKILQARARITFIRIRGKDECCRKIEELRLTESPELENLENTRDPYLILRLPIMPKGCDEVSIWFLKNGLKIEECFNVNFS